MHNFYPCLLVTCLSILGFQPLALALTSDRDQPIHLEADSANVTEGLHVYTGNVSVTQGSMVINAENVTISFNNGDISTLVAVGHSTVPAYLKQALDSQDDWVETWAEKITYAADQDKITLQGNGRLRQDSNEFLGDTIFYSTKDESIIAKAKPNTNQRVQLTIFPNE